MRLKSIHVTTPTAHAGSYRRTATGTMECLKSNRNNVFALEKRFNLTALFIQKTVQHIVYFRYSSDSLVSMSPSANVVSKRHSCRSLWITRTCKGEGDILCQTLVEL
jgi:hypothetical protein